MSEPKRFSTNYKFSDRETRARYVWLKYQSIISGRVLDVGADKCHLKQYLPPDVNYVGIGLGGSPDIEVDLEKNDIPFETDSVDCVLCTDVLEHLDNIHHVFDELCRVSRKWIIISLPNVWNNFYNMLRQDIYRPEQPLKFYGLPVEAPEDRHKWFFSYDEAEQFIRFRANKNGFSVAQMEPYEVGGEGEGQPALEREQARSFLFRDNMSLRNLYFGPLWCVLEK